MKEPVRMQEIAAAAGVSVATVSRALNNHPAIPGETRTRIRRIARRLGYRPNPMIGALMTQIRGRKRSPVANLACLHGQPPWPDLARTQADFLDGTKAAAWQLGYHVGFFDFSKLKQSPEELAHVWKSRNVRGVILKNFRPEKDFQLPWNDFAWVVSGHNEGIPPLHRVGNAIYQIVKLALEQAFARGYQRPVLAMPMRGPRRAGYRWSGAFLGNLLARSPKPGWNSVFQDDWSQPAFAAWFRKQKPDVILSLHDQPRSWLESMKVKVPAEVGFLHLAANISTCKASGVVQDFFRGGEAAIHALDSELRRNEIGIPELPTTFTVAGKWQEGRTLLKRASARPVR